MKKQLSVLVSLALVVVALAVVLSPAGASAPVEIQVSAVNADGSQGCTGCKLDLKVAGTVIDVTGNGNGNLTGTAEFKNAGGLETTLNINESKVVAGRADAGTGDGGLNFVMVQLRDTGLSGGGVPMTVQIRLMPGAPIVRVRDSAGTLLVEFSPGEYSTKIDLQ